MYPYVSGGCSFKKQVDKWKSLFEEYDAIILPVGRGPAKKVEAVKETMDENRNIKQICYTYRNEPKAKIQERSPIHYGSVILDIETDCKMSK